MAAYPNDYFRLAGKPADGQLTRDEFTAQLKSVTEQSPSVGSAGSNGSDSSANSPGTTRPKRSIGETDPAALFDRWDTKHTGKITVADVPEKSQRFFKYFLLLDGKPADGSLNKQEFIAAAHAFFAKRGLGLAAKPAATDSTPNSTSPSASNASGANGKPRQTQNNGFDVDTLVERLMKRSSRPDGKLTKNDLPPRMQARFDKIDTNQDGLISEGELRTWLNKVKRRLSTNQVPRQAGASPSNNGNSANEIGTNTTTKNGADSGSN